MGRTGPRTEQEREAIAEGQRRAWAARQREAARIAARVLFYEGVAQGLPNPELLARAVEAQRLDVPEQRYRWNKWIEVLSRPGCRIKIVSLPAEIHVGPSLAALDAARELLADDAALAAAVDHLTENPA